MSEPIDSVLNKIEGAKLMKLTSAEYYILDIVKEWVLKANEETAALEQAKTLEQTK